MNVLRSRRSHHYIVVDSRLARPLLRVFRSSPTDLPTNWRHRCTYLRITYTVVIKIASYLPATLIRPRLRATCRTHPGTLGQHGSCFAQWWATTVSEWTHLSATRSRPGGGRARIYGCGAHLQHHRLWSTTQNSQREKPQHAIRRRWIRAKFAKVLPQAPRRGTALPVLNLARSERDLPITWSSVDFYRHISHTWMPIRILILHVDMPSNEPSASHPAAFPGYQLPYKNSAHGLPPDDCEGICH